MRRYNAQLAWRWLDPREYECTESNGCWGLTVRTRAACTKELVIRLGVEDADGRDLGTITSRRRSVARGRTFSFVLAAPDRSAQTAFVEQMRCSQKPKPKPKPPARRTSRPRASNCTPGYSPCLPPASDYDCRGGSGNGPRYTGYVRVTGSDPYGLDADNDGAGCE